jgi:alpha-N-arabinofuranosidase
MEMKTRTIVPILTALLAACALAQAPSTPVLKIDAAKPGPAVSLRYGLMTEEINFSYDGGLYAELVRNRAFKEDAKEPVHWSLVQEAGAAASMSLDPAQPLNAAVATSLKLTIAQAGGKQRAGIANEGFWGIPVRPGTRYRASFYAKASAEFKGPITLQLVSDDGATVHSSARIPVLTGDWKKYQAVLTTTAKSTPSAKNKLVLSAASKGTVWFSMVSLFPPTFNNRPNGNRPDIMRILADFKPAFLRFPGGNYLEGNTIETRFDWKKTIGDIATRPGHMNDAWRYWSSDGMGLLEFLLWCEDLHMQPVLGVYAGYSLRQQRVKPGADLEPYVKDALAPRTATPLRSNWNMSKSATRTISIMCRAAMKAASDNSSMPSRPNIPPSGSSAPRAPPRAFPIFWTRTTTAAPKTIWPRTRMITTPARAPAPRCSRASGPRAWAPPLPT